MSLFYIRTVNSVFVSRDQGAEYDRPEDALSTGIQGAVSIGSDEIVRGERSAAIEVRVEEQDGTVVLRSIVAVSVSPLSTILVPNAGQAADKVAD